MSCEEGSRRQSEEFEHDFVGEIRFAQPFQHLGCVLGSGHEQIADEHDGRQCERRLKARMLATRLAGLRKTGFCRFVRVGTTAVRGAAGDAFEGAALDGEHRGDGIAPPAVEGQRACEIAIAHHHLHHEIGAQIDIVQTGRHETVRIDVNPARVLPGEIGDPVDGPAVLQRLKQLDAAAARCCRLAAHSPPAGSRSVRGENSSTTIRRRSPVHPDAAPSRCARLSKAPWACGIQCRSMPTALGF